MRPPPSVSAASRPGRRWLATAAAAAVLVAWIGLALPPLLALDGFEQPPISYSETAPSNPVSDLQARLDRGEVRLAFKERAGYLESVLELLRVPVSSQTLVFSKTSLQLRFITPRTPRAVYFNDDVYVGFVRGGDVIEVSVADPLLGAVFYTLDQVAHEQPRFTRQTDNCLICHGGSQTRGVPGHIVRSLYADRGGQPIFSAGSHRVDDTTPLADRWGGWYVSGRHGDATHLGNVTYRKRPEQGEDRDTTGFNQVDLRSRFDASAYLSPHSDLVALTVLAHQASAHTILAKAAFDARMALHREAALNRELGEAAEHRWPSTDTVLDAAAEALVDCFLFRRAAPLPAPISGASRFAEEFAATGPRDARGRSLKDLDLRSRLLRHPCSFLIHSKAFDSLPDELRRRFWAKMDAMLRAEGADGEDSGLNAADRSAIRDILWATKSGAPRHWATQ